MQRLTCTLTLYMNVCNFLRSLPSLVCRDCDMGVCMCVYHCSTGDCKSTFFYARNSPAWTNYSYGKKQNLKKKSRKKCGLCMFQNHWFIWEFTVFRASKTIFRGWKQGRAPVNTYIVRIYMISEMYSTHTYRGLPQLIRTMDYLKLIITYGYGSKPCTPGEHPRNE